MSDKKHLPNLYIDTAISKFLDSCVGTKKANTIKNYRSHTIIFINILRELRVFKTKELTWGIIETLVERIKNQKNRVSNKNKNISTINQEIKTLKILLNWWKKNKIARLAEDSGCAFIHYEKRKKPYYRYLLRDGIKKLLDVAEAEDLQHATKIAPFIRFLLLTGMRVREALAITWDNYNADAQLILVPSTIDKMRTSREIVLAICPTVASYLDNKSRTGPRIFEEWNYQNVEYAKNRLTKNGVPKFNFKDLRTTCAFYMSNCIGKHPRWESQRLGCSIDLLWKLYLSRFNRGKEGAKTLEEAMEI